MVEAFDRAAQVLVEVGEPTYPETRIVVLRTLAGRKSGRVTVGESRLLAAMVLGVLRAHGVSEARQQWPQLGDDELAVLAQLAGDLAAEDEEDDD